MTSFGFGSVLGAWLGGKLTDKIGYYYVMLWSLILSGILFVLIQFITPFWGFCAGIFLVMIAADSFRPAAFVAINVYSKPENRTRSVSLLRLAINLGFSFGPAAGGLIITHLNYSGLFWVDGITCVLASFFFIFTLNKKDSLSEKKSNNEKEKLTSPYRDKPFLLFLFIILLIGFSFYSTSLQYPCFIEMLICCSKNILVGLWLLTGY
jgi:MFS family permease